MNESEQDAMPDDEDTTVVRPGLVIAEVADADDVLYDDDVTVVGSAREVGEAPENEDATVVRPRPVRTPADAAGAVGLDSARADFPGDRKLRQDHRVASRRATNLMPPVYGPRPVGAGPVLAPEAPVDGGVEAGNARAQLPSVARRDQRARILTLAGYAAVVCVTGVGLWLVATLAFAG